MKTMNGNLFSGKKLLVLGGAYQHCKVVVAAKNLGVETYVTDYLEYEDSPAKHTADHYLMLNIMDVDGIVDFCKKEKIDGVIGPYLDPVQKPYAEICRQLDLPCFGSNEQTEILTDKSKFKKFCIEHGADVIDSYSEEQVLNGEAVYPVLIKPSDSRGSRGQTVCYKKGDVPAALEFAKSESRSGGIEIERYMGRENDVQLIYLVVDSEPVLLRIEDRFLGHKESNLDRLCVGVRYPSEHYSDFMKNSNQKIVNMLRALELKNSPVFIQAFMDGTKTRLYDPGIRMPGDENDLAYKYATGIDMSEAFVRFALTGEFGKGFGEKIKNAVPDKSCLMVLPCLRAGKIKKIAGADALRLNSNILAFNYFYHEGDSVENCGNVKQRFAEILIGAGTKKDTEEIARDVFRTLHVYDENNQEMLIETLV